MEEAKSDIKQVKIDGSLGEGGGQMLRNSLALSSLFMKPLKMEKIRAKRDNPGINRQLQTGLYVMKNITKAKVEGDTVKS